MTFCDDRLEQNQRINHQKTIAVINHISHVSATHENLRQFLYTANKNLDITTSLNFVYCGYDEFIEDILQFMNVPNSNWDNDKLINLICVVFNIVY
jgi:amino acid permease